MLLNQLYRRVQISQIFILKKPKILRPHALKKKTKLIKEFESHQEACDVEAWWYWFFLGRLLSSPHLNKKKNRD